MTIQERWKRAEATRKRRLRTRKGRKADPYRDAQPVVIKQPEHREEQSVSYARFRENESDVYVFANASGYYDCCYCGLGPTDYHTRFAAAMASHLRKHIAAGHTVPTGTIDQILADGNMEEAT
jgi:hypothetical protein